MGMALEALRAYGDFHGLTAADAEGLSQGSPFQKAVFQDGVLSVDYEGCYIDVEPFLDQAAKLLLPGGWGKLDVIDQIDWKLTRYSVENGAWSAKSVHGDQALERAREEAGA